MLGERIVKDSLFKDVDICSGNGSLGEIVPEENTARKERVLVRGTSGMRYEKL